MPPDSGNGVSAVLPLGEWLFIDPKLTVHFRPRAARRLDLPRRRDRVAEGGLATSTLSDQDGVVAHGAQSLLVAPRSA